MIAWRTILYGLVMATIDVGTLGIIKYVSLDGIVRHTLMAIPTMVYALQPWIFLSAMKSETMTVMNFFWDLSSGILVALLGVFYFKEKLGMVRSMGVLLGVLSLSLLAYKGPDDD